MKVFEPKQSDIEINILGKFEETQKKLHLFINENRELIVSKTILPSPVSRHIVYHFDTVIDILVNHQKRHFIQAENVLKINKNK